MSYLEILEPMAAEFQAAKRAQQRIGRGIWRYHLLHVYLPLIRFIKSYIRLGLASAKVSACREDRRARAVAAGSLGEIAPWMCSKQPSSSIGTLAK
jgi:hypothetical protein